MLITSGNFLPLIFFYLGLEKHYLPSTFKTCPGNAFVGVEFENRTSYRNDFDVALFFKDENDDSEEDVSHLDISSSSSFPFPFEGNRALARHFS